MEGKEVGTIFVALASQTDVEVLDYILHVLVTTTVNSRYNMVRIYLENIY